MKNFKLLVSGLIALLLMFVVTKNTIAKDLLPVKNSTELSVNDLTAPDLAVVAVDVAKVFKLSPVTLESRFITVEKPVSERNLIQKNYLIQSKSALKQAVKPKSNAGADSIPIQLVV